MIRPSRSNAYIIDVRHRRSAAQAAVGPGLRAKISVYAGQPVHALGDMESAVRYHLQGTGLAAASEESRLAALYLSLGSEGARICASLCPDGTSFADVRTRLTTRFGDRKSHIYARAMFHTRIQHSDEDVASFVTELRTLLVSCHYDAAIENEILRDRFVAGVRQEKVRERLFMEANDVTLDRCIELAEAVERATSEASKVKDAKSSSDQSE